MDTFSPKKQIGGGGLVTVSDSWDLMDYRQPGSSVHRIFQARILEWVAISFSKNQTFYSDLWALYYPTTHWLSDVNLLSASIMLILLQRQALH